MNLEWLMRDRCNSFSWWNPLLCFWDRLHGYTSEVSLRTSECVEVGVKATPQIGTLAVSLGETKETRESHRKNCKIWKVCHKDI